LRVIAGIAKGTRLKAGRRLDIRPTPDRVKEAIFSIIGERVVGSVFLDLFSGTGALGIEALSRGASKAVLVESSRKSLQIIRKNVEAAGFSDSAQIVASDVYKFIRLQAAKAKRFDIVSADPPYLKKQQTGSGMSLAEKTLRELNQGDIINADGLVFIEHPDAETIACNGVLKPLYTRQYGSTAVSFFEKQEAEI
jgi:16S rRNA (guanine966-N2)-methyltransferase